MRRTFPVVMVASSLLIGCTLPTTLITPPGSQTTKADKKPGALQPAEALNGVEFKPISSSKFLETEAAAQPGAAKATAPVANNAAGDGFSTDVLNGMTAPNGPVPSAAVSVISGNMYGGYSFGQYFGPYGGGTEPMALVSITGAEAAGAKGSFQEVLKAVVGPMVKDWAPDARLVQSSAALGSDGQPYAAPSMPPIDVPYGKRPYPGPYGPEEQGWRLSYISTARNEVLNFIVAPEKTTVIRLRYAPLDLQPEAIAVDSSTALASLIAAIKDPAFKSEEEKTGLDYFMGFKFGGGQVYDDPWAPRIEPLHEVPADARWNVTLQSIMGQPVWEMNFHAPYPVYGGYPAPMPMPVMAADAGGNVVMPEPMPIETPPSFHIDNTGGGMVDARTGTVIRFRRPSKVHYRTPDPSFMPPPYPGKMMPPPPTMPPSMTPPPAPTPTPKADA